MAHSRLERSSSSNGAARSRRLHRLPQHSHRSGKLRRRCLRRGGLVAHQQRHYGNTGQQSPQQQWPQCGSRRTIRRRPQAAFWSHSVRRRRPRGPPSDWCGRGCLRARALAGACAGGCCGHGQQRNSRREQCLLRREQRFQRRASPSQRGERRRQRHRQQAQQRQGRQRRRLAGGTASARAAGRELLANQRERGGAQKPQRQHCLECRN